MSTTINIAARITTGATWPDGGDSEAGGVVTLSAEDSANETLSPRLKAVDADLTIPNFGRLRDQASRRDWHAGPRFMHDECLFFNLENLNTNRRDFDTGDLPRRCARWIPRSTP